MKTCHFYFTKTVGLQFFYFAAPDTGILPSLTVCLTIFFIVFTVNFLNKYARGLIL